MGENLPAHRLYHQMSQSTCSGFRYGREGYWAHSHELRSYWSYISTTTIHYHNPRQSTAVLCHYSHVFLSRERAFLRRGLLHLLYWHVPHLYRLTLRSRYLSNALSYFVLGHHMAHHHLPQRLDCSPAQHPHLPPFPSTQNFMLHS